MLLEMCWRVTVQCEEAVRGASKCVQVRGDVKVRQMQVKDSGHSVALKHSRIRQKTLGQGRWVWLGCSMLVVKDPWLAVKKDLDVNLHLLNPHVHVTREPRREAIHL